MINTEEMVKNELVKDSLSTARTKPLYISRIMLENESSEKPLSNAFYENLLASVIKNPLQSVENSSKKFDHVRTQLLCTGLFKDVDVKLTNDTGSSMVNTSLNTMTNDLGIESVIPTSAIVKLTPFQFNYNNKYTFTTTDKGCTIGYNNAWPNYFGKADKESVNFEANYNYLTRTWDLSHFKTSLSFPFNNNPSMQSVFDMNASQTNKDGKNHFESKINAGIKKVWLGEKFKPLPYFYSGIAVTTENLSDLKTNNFLSKTVVQDLVNKTSFEVKYNKDTRDWSGKYAMSGALLSADYNYSILQRSALVPDAVPNINEVKAVYEKHFSSHNSKITTTLLMNGSMDLPIDYSIENIPISALWADTPTVLKDLLLYKSKLSYKVGFVSSFVLPNDDVKSPLRLQLSLIGSNNCKGLINSFDGYKTDTGVSLVYKTKEAQMSLGYKVPVLETADVADKSINGLAFDVAVTYC